jgi:branched-chain amino acid transport system ATP-binding protein
VFGANSSVCGTNSGHIVHEEPALEIKNQPEVLQRYLGV